MLTVKVGAGAGAAARRRLRLPRPRARQRRAADPVRLLRRPPGPREGKGRPAEDDAVRRHAQGREQRVGLPLAGSAVRSAAERHRRADGRQRQGAPLRDDAGEVDGELRRSDRLVLGRVARRALAARRAGREHRPGLRGHARERERDHGRLPRRHRRRRHRVRRPGNVLRLGRLPARPLHPQVARRQLRAALVGQRPAAAEGDAPHDEGRRGPPDDRPPRDRLAVRRRPVLGHSSATRASSSRRPHSTR